MPMILHYLKRRPNSDLNKIAMWADKLSVTMNPDKSRNVVFYLKGNKQVDPPLILDSNAYMSSKMLSLILTWVYFCRVVFRGEII